jgi:hypothetical protein
MGMDHAGVTLEVWPLAADETGIYLLTGLGPWTAQTAMSADSSPHDEVLILAYQHGGLKPSDLVYVHSPSWRYDEPRVVLTYVVVINCSGPVVEHWPNAAPIGPVLLQAVGRPIPHEATARPTPRFIDVVAHAVRHIRHELDNNDETAAALSEHWRTHTAELQPALAGLYRGHADNPQAA